jgi:hypothetical protein
MATTLTSLLPDAFAAMDVVSRELVGFIPAMQRDMSADRAALNQTIRSFVAPANTTANITPAMTPPTPTAQTIGNRTLSITKSKFAAFEWSGEDQRSADTGPGYLTVQQDQIAQAIRSLVNEVEADAAALHIYASRAYGTAGTTPFVSDLSDTAQLRKILDDNGAPMSDRHVVIDTGAGAKMRTLTQLTKVNEAADTGLLRQGVLMNIHNFDIRESAQVVNPFTKGTGSAYTTTTAGFAVGTTSIPIITGTGTVLAGDVVTFAGDTNKYVVVTGVAAPGTIVIAAPGLRQAIPASATAMTIANNSVRSMAFSRNAMALATRLPALPKDGDLASDRTVITDPRSGLSLELAYYPGFRMGGYFVGLAWGVANMKPEHTAILLG